MKKHKATKDFNQITDNLFVGTNFCCQTHFEESLAQQGVTADVSMEKERIDAPYGVETFLWLPTEDTTAPSMHQLELGAEHIQHVVEHGHKIYIHCKNGHGRGPTMASAYLVSTGMSAEEAMKLQKKKRPETHLNDEQRAAVRAFENR